MRHSLFVIRYGCMKICICGSLDFFDEMVFLKEKMKEIGHEVSMPPKTVPSVQGDLDVETRAKLYE